MNIKNKRCTIFDAYERLNVELAHGYFDNFLIVKKNGLPMNCRKYKTTSQTIFSQAKEKLLIYPLKKLVQQQKFQDIMNRYDDLCSFELYTVNGEM